MIETNSLSKMQTLLDEIEILKSECSEKDKTIVNLSAENARLKDQLIDALTKQGRVA